MTLLRSLVNGNGTMAQFNHPELGGGGQWMRDGMTMVGDMFNHDSKAKVEGLCSGLSQLLTQEPFVPFSARFQCRQEGRASVSVVSGMLPLLERHLPSFPIRFGRRATAASFSLRQTE